MLVRLFNLAFGWLLLHCATLSDDKVAFFILGGLLMLSKVLGLLFLVSATSQAEQAAKTERLYDFDHKVHYSLITYSEREFLLEIDADTYRHFANQSVFLLRQASTLCKEQPFALKVMSGVQEYRAIPTEPRAYQAPLTVQLRCELKATH